MEYKLQLAAPNEDIIPLYYVAVAKALSFATAGGTPLHEPAFKGRLTANILDLLEEVRAGHLKVCTATGSPLAVDESIEPTAHFGYATRFVNEPDCKTLNRENPPVNGVQILSHIDFGPREIDKNSPNIAWFAKLKMLNEWAERRSDSFVISHERVGWVDERGYVEPTKQDTLDTTEKRDSQKNPSAQKIKTKEKGPAPDLSCFSHEKWYSTFQTAKILVLTPKHVRDILIMEGKLKAEKRPNHWMVQGQTIIDYINRN